MRRRKDEGGGMKIIIVGGGRAILYISRSFCDKGHEVTLINRDAAECDFLAKRTKALVVHGEGTQPKVLEDCGIRTADRLLALTPFDECNYVICRIAKVWYGVASVFALVQDPGNEDAFKEMGLEGTFSVTTAVSSIIEQRTVSRTVRNLQPLADGKIGVTEVVLPADAPSVGRPLKEISFPPGTLVAAILRNDGVIVPNGETVLEAGDRLSFLSMPMLHAKALHALVGDR